MVAPILVPLNLKLGLTGGENITSFLRQSILARFAASQSIPSITSKSIIFTTIRSTLRVWSATIAWSFFTLSLVTRSTLAGVLTDHICNKDSNSNPVSDPSRGGLSSTSPRPLPLIGGRPLPHFYSFTWSRQHGSRNQDSIS